MSNRKALALTAGTVAGLGGALLGYYLWHTLWADREEEDGWNFPSYLSIKILKEDSGVVIGRGGANIQEIEFKTSTKMHFKDELETESHRVLTIRGSQENIELAEILIRQTILNQPTILVSTMKIPGKTAGVKSTLIEMRILQESVLFKNILMMLRIYAKRLGILPLQDPRETKPYFLLLIKNDNESPIVRDSYLEEFQPLNTQDAIEVYVSYTESPDFYYVQKVGRMSVMLDKLVQDMTTFYNEKFNREDNSVEKVEVDDIVACKFSLDGHWYRSRVVKIIEDEYDLENTFYEVEFVDFGDLESKLKTEIYNLKTEFLKLNFQAIACKLSNVKPLSEAEGWSEECCYEFSKLTHSAKWEVLLAKIVEYGNCKEGIKPSLMLFETKGSDNTDIGKELVRLNLAKPN
ncbi:TDRKH [Lepeophtheirus salmonis]|uniref:TDRKH n=1 Tax=Lepeophtheirus salmonis TaxID=72036 RepID=A0A7R8HDQ9_LEPSM|nr:TDRKH [Lepeophtheirus salmonis]CAF3039550.1 TDRKH [Lepeophtheirus salmonis]